MHARKGTGGTLVSLAQMGYHGSILSFLATGSPSASDREGIGGTAPAATGGGAAADEVAAALAEAALPKPKIRRSRSAKRIQ